MKIRLFLMVFCGLLCVGELSAQKHVWTEVSLPEDYSVLGTRYIDYSSIRRLPNGNITYWGKHLNEKHQIEVNCVTKERGLLKRIKIASTDDYGNKINGDEDITTQEDMLWKVTRSPIRDAVDGAACRSAKNISSQSDKTATKKKAVNTTRKKKQ
jgi:hypothetical protein